MCEAVERLHSSDARPILGVEAFPEPSQCSARAWSAAVSAAFASAWHSQSGRAAALQDADAPTAAPSGSAPL